MIFEKFGEERKPVPPKENINKGRRHFLESIGLLVAGAAVGALGALGTKGIFKEDVKLPSDNESTSKTPTHTPKPQERDLPINAHGDVSNPSHKAVSGIEEENSALDEYSFLNGQIHTVEIPTDRLAGNTFSDLYAMYLGIPSGTVMPEDLNVDFKENLAALWRAKFNLPKRSNNERDLHKQIRFLKEHHNLMELAEYLYNSYDTREPNTMTFDAYCNDVLRSVYKYRSVFEESLENKMNTDVEKGGFSHEQLSIINDMGKSITSDTLISLSFTELMPSDDGRINAEVFGFLLHYAGLDFINRIPSVHDMLGSFGPYQITQEALSSKSAGSWAVRMLDILPKNFMPKNVVELLHGKENITAYTLAMLHIAQFVGTRNSAQLRCLSKVMNTLPLEYQTQAILSFVASSHHRPQEAYKSFDDFIWDMYVKRARSFNEEDILRYLPEGDLRLYTKKAFANNKFLMTNDLT